MSNYIEEIVTGERIQHIADLYVGYDDDFKYNPLIKTQYYKQLALDNLVSPINNPKIIFCYTHRIDIFESKLHLFNNKFVLLTHNSDGEIKQNQITQNILDSEKIIAWFGQNICIIHSKLNLLPIGFANSMWEHGNLSLFHNIDFVNSLHIKKENVYFNFKINTSFNKRSYCYESLKSKIPFLQNVIPLENLLRLKKYKFCICPEGNGVDTHRLWECIYLKTVPIVINSDFTKVLQGYNLPLLILDKWEDFDYSNLNYSDYNFENENLKNIIVLNNIRNSIFKKCI